jgi:hypothetical protein
VTGSHVPINALVGTARLRLTLCWATEPGIPSEGRFYEMYRRHNIQLCLAWPSLNHLSQLASCFFRTRLVSLLLKAYCEVHGTKRRSLDRCTSTAAESVANRAGGVFGVQDGLFAAVEPCLCLNKPGCEAIKSHPGCLLELSQD